MYFFPKSIFLIFLLSRKNCSKVVKIILCLLRYFLCLLRYLTNLIIKGTCKNCNKSFHRKNWTKCSQFIRKNKNLILRKYLLEKIIVNHQYFKKVHFFNVCYVTQHFLSNICLKSESQEMLPLFRS